MALPMVLALKKTSGSGSKKALKRIGQSSNLDSIINHGELGFMVKCSSFRNLHEAAPQEFSKQVPSDS